MAARSDTPLVASRTTTAVGKEAAAVEKTCGFLVGMVDCGGGVATDELGHNAAKRFDTKGERGSVEEEGVDDTPARREGLQFLGRDGGVATDELGHNATKHFDTEGERGNVEEEGADDATSEEKSCNFLVGMAVFKHFDTEGERGNIEEESAVDATSEESVATDELGHKAAMHFDTKGERGNVEEEGIGDTAGEDARSLDGGPRTPVHNDLTMRVLNIKNVARWVTGRTLNQLLKAIGAARGTAIPVLSMGE